MSLKMWFLLIFGLVKHQLQLRAEDENNTCATHEKWTVFQRRKYGNVDFFRGWDDYVKGFGNCDGDFWLGLDALHEMTKGGDMSLEINMMSKNTKNHWVAKYSHFSVGPGSGNYTLYVSGYSGNAPYDAFARHSKNPQFSTKDADHDGVGSWNCASQHKGAWWYDRCGESNLNGNFNKIRYQGFWWRAVRRDDYTDDDVIFLCCSEMKIYKRP